MKFRKLDRILIVIALLLTLGGCGGGGGDEFIGAAQVTVSTNPPRIDTGDRTQVTVRIREVHENGIVLKIRFPEGLEYVLNSSFLQSGDDDEVTKGPAIDTIVDNDHFLIYFLDQDDFDESDSGTLIFELEGTEESEDGAIEVDADVDDPLVDNSIEFDPNNPEFGAEDEASIEVAD